MDDVRAVMDAAGSERAAILGVGEGGLMAAMFAATHPDRTSALILGNSAARLSWAPDYPIGLPAEQQEMLIRLVEQTWGTPEFALASNPSLAHDSSIQPQVARFLRLAASPATAAAVFRMLLQLDIRPILPSIRVATLVIHRRDSQLLTVDNGRYLAEHIQGATFVELQGADYGLELGDVDSVVDEIQEFLTGTPAAIDTDRVLATVVFTDIVGSTERSAELGDQRWRDVLDAHDRLAERQLARYRGTLVKATGDGLVATFDGPARAIWCALALRDGLRSLGVEIRGGVHCGEIERRGPDVSGLAVHIAARVQTVARPGEVLVTRTVKDLVAGAQIAFVDRGPHALKGVPDEWQLFAVGGG
jgi:class 3 adenylate cyclase